LTLRAQTSFLGLGRAARRRLQRGRVSLLRIDLGDGRWIDVFARRSDRVRPAPDDLEYLRQVLVSVVARTNVVDASGSAIDPGDPDAWRALSDSALRLASRGLVRLIREGRMEDRKP
jgi:hypothetical protein